MGLVFTWLLRLASALIVLAVIAVAMVYYLAARSLPDYDQVLGVPYLDAPVEIVRDNANVPHIFGANDADVFYALGYAHAQDRLWQMTTMRRATQGRLSEVFGAPTVEIDKLMRRLDIYALSVASLDAQDDPTVRILRSYATGVNARLDQVNQQALGRGAPEMFVFNAPIAPWRPADSLAIVKLMGLRLSGHLDAEVLRARMSLALPDPDRLSDILPDAPGTGVAALPEYAALFPTVPRFSKNIPLDPHPLSPFARRPMAGASNVWAAAPSRSAAGGTLLANDPHMGFSAPGIWYLARLDLESGGVIGGTIPGMPVVLTGRSADLGWGLTSAGLDDQDVYIEQINPDNPEEYRTPGGFKAFDTRKSIINIKDETPITITLRQTENGPVLPGTHYNLASITPPGHVASLAWTVLSPRDTSLAAAIRVMRAKSVADGIAAAEDFVAPAQNLTLVDRETIGMKLIGAAPRRDARHQSKGRLPSPGWISSNRWQGRLPYNSNPEFLSPAGGILGN
ncbi:MAG: penicillin acylase family protein, partial [Pseudomonadota bacterium]